MSSSTDHQPAASDPSRIDSPMVIRYVPVTFDNADNNRSARELVEALNPAWKVDEGITEFVRFTDGITNTLTKATKIRPGRTEAQNDDEAILMRAYGQGTDVLIDREREMKAHELLANMGLAPPLLARFNNGLMYKFVQGQVCTPEDLRTPEIYRAVAKRLGQWHASLPISAITLTPDLSDGKQDKHSLSRTGKATRPLPNIWSVMQQWINALPSATLKEKQRNATLNTELQSLSAEFGDTVGLGGRNYIFGHCDLLSGNVIVERPSGEAQTVKSSSKNLNVSFIDYEYSTPSPAAFDIANHFAEWAGFDCDHAAVPTKSQRRDFLKHYVGSFHYHAISDHDTVSLDVDLRGDVDELYDQIDRFRGLPGFYWGIWALIQATISQIDFDYASYAELRLGEYWAWKGEVDGSREREGRELSVRERRWAEE